MHTPFTHFLPIGILSIFLFTSYTSLQAQTPPVAHFPFDGNAEDISGNQNHGTVFGARLTEDRFGQPDRAYAFDGEDDYIEFISNQQFEPELPVTIAVWIQLADYDLNNVFRNNYLPDTYSGVWLNSVEGKMAANYGDGGMIGPTWRRSKIGTTTLTLNTWYHVAVVIRGAKDMDVYLNGQNDCGEYSGTGGNLAYLNATGRAGEGDAQNGPNPHRFFHGKMDDLRLYDRELSVSEIQQLADFEGSAGNSPTPTQLAICSGGSIQLDAGEGKNVRWEPATGLSCRTCPDPVATPEVTTEYTLTYTNDAGCESIEIITVEVVNEECDPASLSSLISTQLVMSNVFTPNGDQINDNFLPVKEYNVFQPEMTIVDRWGRLCYQGNNLQTGWDGTLRGKLCKEGVYFWRCTYQNPQGKTLSSSGNVTLLR